MKNARDGQKGGRQNTEPRPGCMILLAAASERAPPQVLNVVSKCTQACDVGWYRVVGEVAAHHLPQPLAPLRNRLVQTSPQFLLDGSQLGTHPVPARLPLELEEALSGATADVSETND
jgi:hypothetical protein